MASYHGHTYGTSPADEAFALYIAAKEPGSHQRLSSSASLLSAYSSAIDEESDEDLEANAAAGPSASGSSATLRSNYVAAEALLKPRTSFVSSERTPLLAGPNVLPSADLLPDKEEKLAMVAEEWSILLRYTLPVRGYRLEDTGLTAQQIYLTHLAETSLLLTTVLAVGHIGTTELAASTLASMTANLTALSFIHGLVAALDTLCPQAWTSANPQTTSLYALRTQCILLIMLVPQFCIFWNAERILLALKQDPAVAAKAGQYLRVLFPGLPGCRSLRGFAHN
jgi:hypothetical protein